MKKEKKQAFKDQYLKSGLSKPKKELVAVRLPIDIKDQLEALAKKKGQSLTDVIISALRYALDLSNTED